MAYTKRQFIEAAFQEIGLASYVFDLQPDQLQSALQRLDAMMAAWNALGIRIGYPLPSSPQDSSLDEETGVPDSANQAIFSNLGIKLAPGYGKQVSIDTKVAAREAYNTLLSRAAMPSQMQLPDSMPRGAGNKPYRGDNTYLNPPVNPLLAGQDGSIQF